MLSNINKWDGSKKINRPDAFINGDTLSDLRTTDNSLSVWKADTSEDLNDALVALALNRDKVDKIAYCFLDETILNRIEIQLSGEKQGAGPGLDSVILSKHRDLIDLDFWRLGYLAEYMLSLLNDTNNQKVISRLNVKHLLVDYKDAGKIDITKMNPKLKADLKW